MLAQLSDRSMKKFRTYASIPFQPEVDQTGRPISSPALGEGQIIVGSVRSDINGDLAFRCENLEDMQDLHSRNQTGNQISWSVYPAE